MHQRALGVMIAGTLWIDHLFTKGALAPVWWFRFQLILKTGAVGCPAVVATT